MREPEKRFLQVDVLEKPVGYWDLPLSSTAYGFVLDMTTVCGFGESIENTGCTRVQTAGGWWFEVAMKPQDFEDAFRSFTGHGIWRYGVSDEQ